MTLLRYRIIRRALLISLAMTFTNALARAQSPTPPNKRPAIQLTSQKVTLPFGDQAFTGSDAATLTNSRCLMCHSKDMIDAQPPLSLESWKKEVDKMRTAYGCPLRADQTDGIAKFIFEANHASAAGGD